MSIIRDMTIDSIFATYPHKAQKLATVLSKAGLQCVGCCASTWETLEAGAMSHGMDDAVIQKLLNDLNAIIAEENDLGTITMTKKAAERFKSICEAEGKVGFGVRFDQVPAGCSGFENVLDFSEKADKEHDEVFAHHGIEVHVKKKILPFLLGSEIDFADGLNPGFKISNPNVKSSCGCGNSHGY